MWGSVERDIRRIPGVVSCLVTDAEVVVLVDPSTDASAVHDAVSAILVAADDGHQVRVAGGFTPVARGAVARHALRPAALVAAIGATAALGLGSLVGGWLGSIDRAPRALAPSTAPDVPVEVAPPTSREQPAEVETPPRRPIRIITASGDVTPASPTVGRKQPLKPVGSVDTPTPPRVVVSADHPGKAPWRSCEVHPVIEVLAAGKGGHAGDGPTIWSKSIRLRQLDDCWWGRPR